MNRLLKRLLVDECGQDIIEYAMLGAGLAIVGIAAWQNIGDTLGDKYAGWDRGVQELWDPDPPIAGGS